MASAVAMPQRPRSLWYGLIQTLRIIGHNPRSLAGLIILLFFALMASIGPEVIPLDLKTNYAERYAPISWKHPLSTDFSGRDVLQLLVHGSREVLTVAFLAGVFTVLIAVTIGLISGLRGGATDAILMLLTNAILTIPSFPVMLMLGAVLTIRDPVSLALVLSCWAWGGLARATRSQVLSLKRREFIEAAQVLGLSLPHIVFRELLPNIAPYVAISFMTIMRGAITASVGLMFLGLVPFQAANWGMMLNMATGQMGSIYVPDALVYVLTPMVAIILFQLGAIFFAHGLDEVFDPRLRA